MNRGYVRLWRKSMDAGWIKNHKLWAFWTYCLMKASHKEFDAVIGLQVVHLMPGQFIFGRKKAVEETGLTEREIRTIIALLIKAGNMTIKTTNKFSVISIVNWPIYQGDETENDQQNDQQTTSKRPHTNTGTHEHIKTPGEILLKISELGKRYPDQEIINQTFQAISSTRKSNRIADSVKLSILQSWEQYPVESVMAGIRTYLDKGYGNQGKKESYLLGIIRNVKPEASISGLTRKATGSPLLDDHYRSQGIRII
ncbi:MAG: hypothetical protein NTV58_14580 [Deltaproteobacteria bacterium]|nr:hypothetical protein [Deltaproteobacteria bacterium]